MTGGIFAASSAAMGGLLGAALAFVGSMSDPNVRLAIAGGSGLIFIIIACAQLLGLSPPIPQLDRETPRVWLQRGWWRWALMNGAALGSGFYTRIGLWAWYSVPVGSFLLGDPFEGAAIYGSYGLARAYFGVGQLVLARRRSQTTDAIAFGISRHERMVVRGSAIQIGLIGMAFLVLFRPQ